MPDAVNVAAEPLTLLQALIKYTKLDHEKLPDMAQQIRKLNDKDREWFRAAFKEQGIALKE